MKRRVTGEINWAVREGESRGGGPIPDGPKLRRRAKRRQNRLERREAKEDLRDGPADH